MEPTTVRAVFFLGQQAVTIFTGSEKQYLINKGRNDISVRKLNDTQFFDTLLEDMPTLEEFDAQVAGA